MNNNFHSFEINQNQPTIIIMAEEGKTPKLTVKKVKVKASNDNFGGISSQVVQNQVGASLQPEDASKQQQLLVNEMEAFLISRQQFILALGEQSSLADDINSTDDKFLSYLEQAANGQITVQDLHSFSVEPRSKTEPYKAAVTYVLNLRSKATTILQQLKLSQLTSNSQNELLQEVAKLKSKLRSLENVKKDEIQKRLEAKESECLEYRAKLSTAIQPLETQAFEPKSQGVLDAEIEKRMAEFQTKLDEGHSHIKALLEEIKTIKTSVRERTVIPRSQIPEVSQSRQELISKTEEEEVKEQPQRPDDISRQDNLPESSQQSQPSSIQNPQQLELHQEVAYLESLDQDQVNHLLSLQIKLSSELEVLHTLEETLLSETRQAKGDGARVLAKEQQIMANNRYLESKLAETLTLKEEQNIKLKSEIVIYKNKIQAQKIKMKEVLATFETEKISEMRQQMQDALSLKDLEISQLSEGLDTKVRQVSSLEAQLNDLSSKLVSQEQDYESQLNQQQQMIQDLSDRLKGIDQSYSQQLQQVDTVRENTQKKLNIEEQERTMNSLKLDYLVNNNKKLQLQKRFLEKTLDKDLKNLATEMRKSEIDMQRDAFITSQTAHSKLNNMYSLVKESLQYVKEVIQFMNFEMGDQIYAKQQDDRDEIKIPKRKQDQEQPATNNNEDNQGAGSNEDQPVSNLQQKPLDFYFQRHIYEISEVLLSIICEFYQESKTQTTQDTVHLFTLIQSKTNKQIVNDLYNRFFSQGKIQFIQHLSRTMNRNYTLEREKAEIRKKLEDYQKSVAAQTQSLNLGQSQNNLGMSIQKQNTTTANNQPVVVNTEQIATMSPQKNSSNLIVLDESQSPSRQQTGSLNDSVSPGRMKPDQVVRALVRFQERKIIEIQSQEMSALKQRMKEVRLHLQRQINDLQDQLQLAKEQHLAEMTKLRLEYGRDLDARYKGNLREQDDMRADLENQYHQKMQQLQDLHKEALQKLSSSKENEYESIIKVLELKAIKMHEYEMEIKKLKKRAFANAQGGWGTFSIVFEDNVGRHKPIQIGTTQQTSAQTLQNPSGQVTSTGRKSVVISLMDASPTGSSPNMSPSASANFEKKQVEDANDHGLQRGSSNVNNHYPGESLSSQMPLEKLQHYIEVGFTLDPKNYRYLETYKEKAYDSSITKYLFEFQDPDFNNEKTVEYQKKIKNQLEENYALFNEINPIYIAVNLGRNVSQFSDDQCLPMEYFRLIKRVGHHLGVGNGGDLMVNFLRCDKPSLIIRVVAFDSDSCSSYALDLTYEDLVLFVEGNTKLFDPEQKYSDDLCQLILNNLTLVRRPLQSTGPSGGLNGGISVHSDDEEDFGANHHHHDFDMDKEEDDNFDGDDNEGGGHQTVQKNPKLNLNESINKRLKQPNTEIKPPPRLGESSLAVEHKIFLNIEYKRDYDYRNDKLIKKNHIWREAFTRSQEINTDFEMSTVYEAYDIIYQDNCFIDKIQFNVVITRGNKSGNLILKISDPNGLSQELCMYQSEQSKKGQTHQIASAIIRLDNPNSIAYVVSFEKLYQSDNLVIRIIELHKYDPLGMSTFYWDPLSKAGTFHGSLVHEELTVYLVKKNNGVYLRLQHFEVLNTEIRSLLFRHSYGYDMSLVDFGRLQSVVKESTINLRNPIDRGNGYSPSNKPLTIESLSVQGMNFVYRDFGILRVKTLTMILQSTGPASPPKFGMNQSAIKEVVNRGLSQQMDQTINEDDNEPGQNQLVNNQEDRVNTGNDEQQQQMEEMSFAEMDHDDEIFGADEEFFQVENHYSVFSFYDDYKCLSRGEIYIQIKIDGEFKLLTEKVSGVATLLKLTPDEFRDKIQHSSPEEREKLCKQIFDKIVIVKSVHSSQPLEDGSTKEEVRYRAVIDTKIQPMSEVIELLKQQKLKLRLDEHDLLDSEYTSVKNLGINLNVLAECQKSTQISIINRKIYKVTCYFINNLKNIKLAPLPNGGEKQFEWQIIYVEAETRTSTKNLSMVITESDLTELTQQLFSRQSAGSKLLKDKAEILNNQVDRKRLIEFIVDAIIIDEQLQTLKLSISHLLSRMEDRIQLSNYFKITGGRYLPAPPVEDPEMSRFTSSLPQIEISRRMLVNIEREFADRKYDIRIFEVKIKHAKDEKKYQFEMFAVDSPSVIFRADFLSQAHQQGKKLMIERFNIIQQQHQDFEDNKFMKDGMVLAVLEQGFPHSLTFMVLEPMSHIQWQFSLSDDKLNPIENRVEKEFFVKNCKKLIENGFWFSQLQPNPERNAPQIPIDIVNEIKQTGYQKNNDTFDRPEVIELWSGNLRDLFIQEKIIYQKQCLVREAGAIDPELFAEIAIISDQEFGTLRLVINGIGESSFVIENKRECSRFLSGLLPVNNKVKLLYTIQTSTGYTEQERAIRVIIHDPVTGKKILDVVLAEKHIIDVRQQKSQLMNRHFNIYDLKQEVKYAFNTGFKDSFALFKKLPDLITDFKQAFIVNEERLRFQIQEDTSVVIYRKVVNVFAPQKHTFLIFAKSDNFESVQKSIKVILSEQLSGYEETFLFDTASVLTKEEHQVIESAVKAQNDRAIRECIGKAIDQRLKIKTMNTEELQAIATAEDCKMRYVAYFMEISALAPDGPLQGAAVVVPVVSKAQQDLLKFDIRNGQRFSLTEPEVVLIEKLDHMPQEKLLSQLEKGDLLFDVSEVINPFHLILRVKTYDSDSLRVLSVNDINEQQLKEELTTDHVSYLLAEPSRREELCKYIVQNIHYDDLNRRVYFLKSTIQP